MNKIALLSLVLLCNNVIFGMEVGKQEANKEKAKNECEIQKNFWDTHEEEFIELQQNILKRPKFKLLAQQLVKDLLEEVKQEGDVFFENKLKAAAVEEVELRKLMVEYWKNNKNKLDGFLEGNLAASSSNAFCRAFAKHNLSLFIPLLWLSSEEKDEMKPSKEMVELIKATPEEKINAYKLAELSRKVEEEFDIVPAGAINPVNSDNCNMM